MSPINELLDEDRNTCKVTYEQPCEEDHEDKYHHEHHCKEDQKDNCHNNHHKHHGPTGPTGATGATGATGPFPVPANQIYVANSSSNNVSVIDGLSNTVIATVAVGASPLD